MLILKSHSYSPDSALTESIRLLVFVAFAELTTISRLPAVSMWLQGAGTRCRAAACADSTRGCTKGVPGRAHPMLPTEPLTHTDIPLKSCFMVFQAVAAFIRCGQTAGPNYNTNWNISVFITKYIYECLFWQDCKALYIVGLRSNPKILVFKHILHILKNPVIIICYGSDIRYISLVVSLSNLFHKNTFMKVILLTPQLQVIFNVFTVVKKKKLVYELKKYQFYKSYTGIFLNKYAFKGPLKWIKYPDSWQLFQWAYL